MVAAEEARRRALLPQNVATTAAVSPQLRKVAHAPGERCRSSVANAIVVEAVESVSSVSLRHMPPSPRTLGHRRFVSSCVLGGWKALDGPDR